MFTPMRTIVSGGKAFSYLIPVVLIFIFDKLFLRKQTLVSIFVVLIITFLHNLGVGYFENYIPNCMTLLFGVFALEHYFVTRDNSYATWVLITEFVTLFIMIAISIPLFITQPNLTRMIFKAAEDSTIDFEYYWCISYGTIHELPVLSIPIFALYQNSKKRIIKVLALTCLALMFFVMIYSSSTTSLMLLVAVYIIMLFYNKKQAMSQNIVKLVLIMLLVLPFMSENVILGIIDKYMLPVFEGSSISNKLNDYKYYIITGETDGSMGAREDKYNITLNSITSNPLLPEFDDNCIGQHSYLMDHLAAMGLFLFIPFCIFLYTRYKRPLRFIPHMKFYYIIATFVFLLLASIKNFFIFIPAMFIVPLLLIQMENKKNKWI